MSSELSFRRRIALELAGQLYSIHEKGYPLKTLFWECTLKCNLHCRHCGSDCKQVSQFPDMPFSSFAKVLDEVAAEYSPHDVFVVITGGEPLMRPDLDQCGRAIYDRGFPWGMVSNGFALTKDRFTRLLRAGLHSLTISLDGLEDSHDWMRGKSVCFSRTADAIAVAAACPDIKFDVVTCVNRKNIGELPQIRDFLISLGVKEWRLFSIFPSGRAADDPMMKLAPEEFRALMEFIKETRKGGKIKAGYGCEGFLGRYEGDVRDYFFHCQAGITVGSVLADGSISACPSIRADYHQGNISSDSFVKAWKSGFLPYRDREWMRKDECAECKYFRYCKGNGMHLRGEDGKLMLCHLKELQKI